MATVTFAPSYNWPSPLLVKPSYVGSNRFYRCNLRLMFYQDTKFRQIRRGPLSLGKNFYDLCGLEVKMYG